MYLITEEETKQLSEGKLKLQDIIKAENFALITWSGKDVIAWIEENKDNINKELLPEIDDIIYDVAHNFGHCDCGECFRNVMICLDYIEPSKKEA